MMKTLLFDASTGFPVQHHPLNVLPSDRKNKTTFLRELAGQQLRKMRSGSGNHDRLKRGFLLPAKRTVSEAAGNRNAQNAEPLKSPFIQLLNPLDGIHPVTERIENSGLITRAGPDFKNSPRGWSVLNHQRGHVRYRIGLRNGLSVPYGTGMVFVRRSMIGFIDEAVPVDTTHGLEHLFVGYALAAELFDHFPAPLRKKPFR